MVLQNKYKARASRRYNSSRGGSSDTRGRGGGGRGRGAGHFHGGEAQFPSLNGGEQEDGDERGEDADDLDLLEGEDEGGEVSDTRNKYSRRRLESNAWRYQEDEVDPLEEAEKEPELEVDLSGLLARVAKLDSSRTSKAFSSREGVAGLSSGGATKDDDDDDDIDQSLLYLLDRQRERQAGKGAADENSQGMSSKPPGITSSEMKQLEIEGKRLLEERERERRHYGRAQMLKTSQSKTISLNIGENRSKKCGKPARTVERVPRNVNVGTLYDAEDDDDEEEAREDGVDAFFKQLDLTKGGTRVTSSRRTLEKPTSPTSPPAALSSSMRLQADEDFLDSII
ncbi:hypothetical protein CBS101457_004579 [Exobasidium rhododendri]|nr:hypothetical protein CBS101457_004579 [Exobasidium rhododendri]